MIMTATSSSETHNSGVLAKLGLIFMSSLCWLQPTKADEQTKQQPIKVFISPECKDMFYGPDFLDTDAHGKVIKKEKKDQSRTTRHGIQLALSRCHTRTQAPQLPFT